MIALLALLRRLAHYTKRLSWGLVVAVLALHCLSSYAMMLWANEERLVDVHLWLYYYMVTITSIGYGDFSPQTQAGRWIATLWLIPGGIGLFASVLGKSSAAIFDFWRRGLMGKLDYSELSAHTILVGWHGEASERIVDLLLEDMETAKHGIVLCGLGQMENPMPEKLRFVRGDSFHSTSLLKRAGLTGASRVLIYGNNDEENLAIALTVLRNQHVSGSNAHVVTHFEDSEVASLLKQHYPQAECTSTLAVEMLVRAAQDPGTSRVTDELLSIGVGPTQFALQLPKEFPRTEFGKLFSALKLKHDATLLGIANDRTGVDLILNPPVQESVSGGQVLFYMSKNRLTASAVSSCV